MWRFTRVDVLCRGDFSRSLGNKRGAIDGEVWEPSRSTAPLKRIISPPSYLYKRWRGDLKFFRLFLCRFRGFFSCFAAGFARLSAILIVCARLAIFHCIAAVGFLIGSRFFLTALLFAIFACFGSLFVLAAILLCGSLITLALLFVTSFCAFFAAFLLYGTLIALVLFLITGLCFCLTASFLACVHKVTLLSFYEA